MNIVVQIRMCHTWCKSCFGDDANSCYSCDYINYGAKLSGNTCSLNCTVGYAYNKT
jgi:hypothetical protein